MPGPMIFRDALGAFMDINASSLPFVCARTLAYLLLPKASTMTSHKRSRSTAESGAESPKVAKKPNTTKPAEDLAQANARIHELEAQVKELQDYIYSQNVALGKSICKTSKRSILTSIATRCPSHDPETLR